MTLSTTITANNTTLEITVEYDHRTNTITEVVGCTIYQNGESIEVGDLMMAHFEECLNKAIEKVDWREVARAELVSA